MVYEGNLVVYTIGTASDVKSMAECCCEEVGAISTAAMPVPLATLTSSADLLDADWLDDDTFLISRGTRFYASNVLLFDWPSDAPQSHVFGAIEEGTGQWGQSPSRDGGRIAFSIQGDFSGSADYERIAVLGSDPELLINIPATQPQESGEWGYHESWPLWETDNLLIFQRGGWGQWSLYRLNVESSEEELLLRDAAQASLSGDRRWLAFARRDPAVLQSAEYSWEVPADVWLMDRYHSTGARFWQLSSGAADAQQPVLSADGRRIAWLERSVDGAITIETRELDAELTREPDMLDPRGASDAHFIPYNFAAEPPVDDQVSNVVLECTNGDIVLECHRSWSPLGYDRFIELVESGYYDGAPWFRVIDGFVAQTGLAADPALTAQWEGKRIKDDPVVMGNKRGYVSFGTAGPNTRGTHIFINFADNSRLDASGFSAFAVVSEGMDVADSLHRIDDQAFAARGLTQGSLSSPGGLVAFGEKFPDADYIVRAYVRE